jgi:Pyridoxamine 5''-phosphate oxidase.
MPLSDTIKTLIRNAWDDGYPCLLATSGPQGPNITPKGSMIVFDDVHLAWWERSKRAVLENLSHDKRVCVIYANFKAQRDGVLESGFLRFFGSAELRQRLRARSYFRQLVATRANPRRRGSRHRRAGQDRQSDRYSRQAAYVTPCPLMTKARRLVPLVDFTGNSTAALEANLPGR